MTWLFLSRKDRRHRNLRRLPANLPPHLMRDIGLQPWPERPRLPFHPLW